MNSLLKGELQKAFRNPYLVVAIIIGTILAIMYAVETWRDVMPRLHDMMNAREIECLTCVKEEADTYSAFYRWIGIYDQYSSSKIFYWCWPILTAMPYTWSYWRERRDGSADKSIAECGWKAYFSAKYLAVFLSGGAVVAWVFVLSFLLNATFLPMITIGPGTTNITNGCLLSKVFYTCPWLYCILVTIICSIFGGVTACLALLLGGKTRVQAMPMLTPFVFIMGVDLVIEFLQSPGGKEISPLRLIEMGRGIRSEVFLVVLLIMFIISFGGSYLFGKKEADHGRET